MQPILQSNDNARHKLGCTLNTPTNKRKLPLRTWFLIFYSLGKINSFDKIIKIYCLIQTQGKFKENRSPITVSFVHLNTNTPEFKIHKNRIPDTDSPTDKKKYALCKLTVKTLLVNLFIYSHVLY